MGGRWVDTCGIIKHCIIETPNIRTEDNMSTATGTNAKPEKELGPLFFLWGALPSWRPTEGDLEPWPCD